MENAKGRPVFFLDFDGVICDSINECFVSSWLAYNRVRNADPGYIGLRERALFASYRPYIRRGADYLLLQYCMDRDIPLRNQYDFDEQERRIGARRMEEFHELFYTVREELLFSDRQFWLELNSIYPLLKAALKKASEDSWILTTKKVDFAFEIALAGGLEWNRDKIICSGTDRKLDIIGEILGDSSGTAIFVDDQIDHFSGPVDPRIHCCLADWGYIENEWLNMGYDVLSQDKFITLLNGFF